MTVEFATMTVMMVLVSDKAREWYKKCVRSEEAKWTLEEVGASILEELFPSNITEILREKFDHAKQGTHSLKEWHRYLTKLGVKWAEAGMGPESAETTLEAMLKLGKVHEKIHDWQFQEAKRAKGRSDKPEGKAGYQRKQNLQGKTREGDGHRGRRGHQDNGQRKGRFKDHQKSSEQAKMYRAEGRCFSCGDKGHEIRNCPKRHEATPSKQNKGKKSAYAGAIEVSTMGVMPVSSLQIHMITIPDDAIDPEYIDDVTNTYCKSSRRSRRGLNGKGTCHNVWNVS